jgi:carbon monoxide dehydrogenase subunit G
MKIESKKGLINRPAKEVFDYLSNMNNFVNLLPKDKISDWESDEKQCSFKIQGAATISFVNESSTEPTHIHMVSGERSPFKFDLDVYLKEEDGKTTGYQIFDADINMFMKMMVEKPLKNLFDYIVDQLAKELK